MTETSRIRYAGFWRRTLAYIIDMVILLPTVLILLYVAFGSDYFAATGGQTVGFTQAALDFLIRTVFPIVFVIFFWLKFLGTPGKLMMECQVVDSRTLGRLSVAQAIGRYLGYVVSILPLCLGIFWIGWDKKKQGFHDKLAKTLVIVQDDTRKTLEELARELG